jgi:hypothetical protein
MKEIILGSIWGVGMLIALCVGGAFIGFKIYEYFAPKYTEVDRRVFEESRAFNEGMIRDLQNLKRQYIQADPEAKKALRATVIHRFSVYPEDRLPPALRSFYNQIQSEIIK